MSRGSAFPAIASAGLARAVTIPLNGLCTLAAAYLVLHGLGASQYGLATIIWSLAAVLPFGDLGLGASIIESIASDGGQPGPNGRAATCRALRYLILSAFGAVGAAGVIAIFGLWPSLLGQTGMPPSTVTLASVVALTCFSINMPLAISQRVLTGFGRTGTSMLLQALAPPIALGITAFGVSMHPWSLAPVFATAALPAGQIVASLAQAVAVKRLTGLNLRKCALDGVRGLCRPTTTYSGMAASMMVITLAIPLALQSDRLLIAHSSHSAELPSYSLSFQFYAPAWSVIGAAGLALWPKFARDRQSGVARGTPVRPIVMVTCLSIVLAAGYMVAMPFAEKIVAGGTLSVSFFIVLAFACLLVVQGTQLTYGMYMTDAPGLRFQAWCVCVMLVANLLASFVLAQRFGAAGPPFASAVCIAVFQLAPQAVYIRQQQHRIVRRSLAREIVTLGPE